MKNYKHNIWLILTSPILTFIMLYSVYKLLRYLEDETMTAKEIDDFIIKSNLSFNVDKINICSFLFWFSLFCAIFINK